MRSRFLLALSLSLAPATALAAGLPFGAANPVAPGDQPVMLAAGDLDGDGWVDLVAVFEAGGQVIGYLNDGAGVSWTPVVLGALAGASAVAIADTDRDGDLDVIASSDAADVVAIYANDGAGGGWARTDRVTLDGGSPTGGGPIAVLDLDRDGGPELITAHANADSGAALTHTTVIGDTGLPTVVSTAAAITTAIAAGDISHDGRGDFVIARSGVVMKWINDGTDDFDAGGAGAHALTQLAAVDGVFDVMLADVDGDADLDVVATANGAGSDVIWFANNGNGVFGAAQTILASAAGAARLHSVDLDRDGDLDLVLAARTAGEILYIENLGAGAAWLAHTVTAALGGAEHAIAADVDGDGDLDVVAAGSVSDEIVWYANQRLHGSPGFGATGLIVSGLDSVQIPGLWDLDTDGDLDLIVSDRFANNCGCSAVHTVQNTGQGATWSAPYLVADNRQNAGLAVGGDADADGDADIYFSGGPHSAELFLNTADTTTTFSSVGGVGWSTSRWVRLDLDRDGDLDRVSASFSRDKVHWERSNNHAASNTSCLIGEIAGPFTVDVGDIDGDGDDDVLVVRGGGSLNNTVYGPALMWLENDGSPCGLWPDSVLASGNTLNGTQNARLADMDRDGDLDVVDISSTGVRWRINDDPTSSSWTEVTIHTASTNSPQVLWPMDYDHDGDMDVLTMSQGRVVWYENTDGLATAWTKRQSGVVTADAWMDIGDLDRDGDLDFVFAEANSVSWIAGNERQVTLNGSAMAPACDSSTGQSAPCIEEADGDAAMWIDVAHTQGRAGDVDVELGELRLQLRSNGVALTDTQAADALSAINVWADDFDDNFAETNDTVVSTTTSFSLTGGVLTVPLPSSAANTVSFGATRRFFIELVMAPTAIAQGIGSIEVIWQPGTGRAVHYAGTDIVVLLDNAPVDRSLTVAIAPLDTDNDGDPDATDCEDNDAAVFAGATETCNAVDDDCDNDVDEDFDVDGDLYFDEADAGCVATWTGPGLLDCDDGDSTQNPLATEVCNGEDDECDAVIDDGFDLDVDGFFTAADAGCLSTYGANADCDDAAIAVFPGATETCNGTDDDCDTDTDEDFDGDGDGFTTAAVSGCVTTYGAAVDCDDAAFSVNPGITEICNAIDDDCDTATDEGFDGDSDGFTTCGADGASTYPAPGADDDCDDGVAAVFPGAAEACDFVDSDCDGSLVDTFLDFDEDGQPDCVDLDDDGDGENDNTDCNDFDDTIYNGAAEACDDLVDSDCDGSVVDECLDTDGDLDPDDHDLDDDGDGMPDAWELSWSPAYDPLDENDAAFDDDGDGRSTLDEYLGGTDPYEDDSPSAPVLLAPIGGSNVDASSPELIVDNATSPAGTALTYRFEIFDDAQMSTLLDGANSVAQGAGSTAWTGTTPLDEDASFWWRAGADDGFTVTFSGLDSFFVDADGDAPTMPVPLYPLTGGVMAGDARDLLWTDSLSPQGQALTYIVTLRDGADTTDLIPPGQDTLVGTAGLPDEAFDVGTWVQAGELYRWQVVARDQTGRLGPASPWQSFGYLTTNTPPNEPVFRSPLDEAQVVETSPDVILEASFDAQGGVITYALAIDDDISFSNPQILRVDGDGADTVTFDLATEGVSLAQGQWYLRARATDVNGASSEPTVITIFVRGANDPPAVPRLVSPEQSLVVARTSVPFVVSAVTDPEGDAVSYEVRLVDREGAEVGGGESSSTTITIATDELGGGYFWSARAVDSQGAGSEWSAPRYVVVHEASWGACSTVSGGGSSDLWWLGLLATFGLRRRR